MNEPLLANFFNISSNAMCVLDENLVIAQSNISFEKILNYTVGDLAGKSLVDFVHDEDKGVTTQYLENSKTSDQPIELTNRMLSFDGSIKWFTWTFHKPHDSQYIFASADDFTLQQEARNQLIKRNRETVEDRAKLDAMLSNIGDGIIGTSDGGEILYINNSTTNILGYTEDELRGKLLMHAIPTVDESKTPADVIRLPLRNALMTGRTIYSRDFQFRKKDGTFMPVAMTASPVKYKGTLLGGVVVFHDITREQEVDRMKTEFISLASHQLRTPLSSMKWFSEALLDEDSGTLNEEQRKTVQNIYTSNERMIELVNALLNISRIESGRLIVEPEPTNLGNVLEEVLIDVAKKLDEKKQKLTKTVHEQLPDVNLDKKLVRHALMNLITNAIKYTPAEGEIEVALSKDENDVVFRISDSGYGIPKAEQEHVFDKFFRAENIKKVETDGTGLGLYLVKEIVEASNGRVWFESEEGKGTSFWIAFPLTGSKKHDGEVALDS